MGATSTIRSVCPFRLVADEDLEQLSRELLTTEVEAGAVVFEEGAPSTGVSALVGGSVEILRGTRVLGVLEPGAVIGEVSLFLPGATRTATARAATPVTLLTWSAVDVPARLAQHERLATAIVADLAHVLAERLDRRTQDVVSLLDVAGRRLPISELERLRSRIVQ